MKKIYVLAIALLSVAFINAQNYDWNISGDAFNSLGKFEETQTVENLTMYAASEKALEVDANNKTLDEVDYTHRLKFGGTGAFDSETGQPLNRVLAFDVNGNATITIMCMSSSSGSDRELTVAAGSNDNIIGTAIALGPELSASVIEYVGEATTIYMWSPNRGVNIYRIIVEGEDTGVSIQNVDYSPVVSTEYYNLSGVYEGTDFNALTSGLYIKVSVLENGSKTSEKVLKK